MEKRLGRGLDALITKTSDKPKEKIDIVRVDSIIPNKLQPRKDFKKEKLEELIISIKEKGVIQPVLVRRDDENYEIIAGERRWRAAKELGLEEIPVIVKSNISDESSLELALIENIQREGFNPMEESDAYKQLIDEYGYTLDKIGQFVGKNKTTVSNSLRLLNLSDKIKQAVRDGQISTGHAKVLLSVESPVKREQIAEALIKQGFSVRQLEQIIKSDTPTKRRAKRTKDPDIATVEEKLQHALGTKVTLKPGKNKGKIEIEYYSKEDLERIISLFPDTQ